MDTTLTADAVSSVTPSFRALGVPDELASVLTADGIVAPFPVQAVTLVDAIAGNDVLVQAPTGSGKTLAYGLAAVLRTPKGEPRRPGALVLVPTRELARQVASVLVPLGKVRRLWVGAVYGGASIDKQDQDLRRGVDICVATPGRLIDLLERRAIDLSAVRFVVIDEADRMADMGFMPPVREILAEIPRERQTLLFSATLDGAVDELVKLEMRDPIHHAVAGADGPGEGPTGMSPTITHHLMEVDRTGDAFAIAALGAAANRTVAFVKSRMSADRLAEKVNALGVQAGTLHGGMAQGARQRAVSAWTRGEVVVLVATDVAARGVHVDGVDLVIHADPVFEEKDYIHRSGRTGRAGAPGEVVHLISPRNAKSVQKLYRTLGIRPNRMVLPSEIVHRDRPPVAEEARPSRVSNGGSGRWEDRGPRRDDRGSRPSWGSTDRPPRRYDDQQRAPRSFDGPRTDGPRTDGPRTDGPRSFDRPARSFDGDRAARPYSRPEGDRGPRSFSSDRPARSFDGPRTDGPRSFNSDRPARPYAGDRPARPAWGRPEDRPARTDGPRADGPRADDRGPRPVDSDRASRPWGGHAAARARDEGRPARPGDERWTRPTEAGRGAWARDSRETGAPAARTSRGPAKFSPKAPTATRSFRARRPD